MKKNPIICLALSLILLLEAVCLPVRADGETIDPTGQEDSGYTSADNSVLNGCHSIDARNPLLGSKKMLETAHAVFLYEVNTDTVVYSWNPDQQLPPASLVKILTAMIALEQGNLDDVVTVTGTAISSVPEYMHGYPGLVVGESFTLEELLNMMLCGSSNDASAVIAEHIAGSQAGFAVMLNDRAKELGCTASNFTDAHGLSEKNQYTTARDMCRILREAIKSEKFMELFAVQRFTVPETPYCDEPRTFASQNLMMQVSKENVYYDRRITGGRTGITNDRNRHLATTSESGNLKYISIVLSTVPVFLSDNFSIKYFGTYEETQELLKMAYSNMKPVQALSKEQISTQFSVANGENNAVAGPNSDVFTVLPSSVKREDLTVHYEQSYASLNAPVNSGDKITNIQIWYGNVCLAQSDLVAKNSVRLQGAEPLIQFQQAKKTNWGAALMILGIAAGVLLVFVLGIRLVNTLRMSQRRAQYKRRSANRKRSR